MGGKGKRYSPRFQFQVVLEVLKGKRDAVEIARAYDLHPTTVSRWKREFLENGAEVFGKDSAVQQPFREVAPLAELGYRQIERAQACIPAPLTIAVTPVDPIRLRSHAKLPALSLRIASSLVPTDVGVSLPENGSDGRFLELPASPADHHTTALDSDGVVRVFCVLVLRVRGIA